LAAVGAALAGAVVDAGAVACAGNGPAASGAAGVRAMASAVTTATDARPVATRVLVIVSSPIAPWTFLFESTRIYLTL
jgi:hypothetical protein